MSGRRCVCGFVHDYGHEVCERAFRSFGVCTLCGTALYGTSHQCKGLRARFMEPARGVPAYHPTEYQPIRVGGPET